MPIHKSALVVTYLARTKKGQIVNVMAPDCTIQGIVRGWYRDQILVMDQLGDIPCNPIWPCLLKGSYHATKPSGTP